MKKGLAFAVHVFVAMVVSTVLGGLLLIVLTSRLGKLKNPWFDVPYSPLFWGSAFLLGLLLNRVMWSPSAKWVWIVGVFWLILVAVGDINAYDPRWCDGCSLLQFIWYSTFSYRNCTGECLGQLIGTTPMLNSIAYSAGAALALRSRRADKVNRVAAGL